MTDIAKRVERCFELHPSRPALVLGGIAHTYAQLRERVLSIQRLLGTVARGDERLIGVMATDTLDTYAAVFAILRSGRAFVPLAAEHPAARNASIVKQAALRTLLATQRGVSLDAAALEGVRVIATSDATIATSEAVAQADPEDLAYLLFTSGSTGEPKGVPITRANLSAFLDALPVAGCVLGEQDRVLQMFDLTFDFSIASYLAPLSHGACVFTVAPGNFKFAEVVRLLDEEQLTVAPMVPSVLTYIRPYFDEVHLPELRLSVFCGEALPADVTRGWSVCAPGTSIINFYGPTEATVFAMSYAWRPAAGCDKTLNGMISIGRPMHGTLALTVAEDLSPTPSGEKGELCLGGAQLTPGYWMDPARNARAFFERNENGRPTRYYRTGDLVMRDPDGDYLFCGRADHQVKLQGFRVELGEIEHHAREILRGYSCVVVPSVTPTGGTELRLVVENYTGDLSAVLTSLRSRVPSYMVPARAVSVARLPLNANNKIDRKALETAAGIAGA